MKNLVLIFLILIGFVSCKNSQDIDNQKDKNLFGLSKYRKFLDSNKVLYPSSPVHKDSSFSILYHRNLDSLSKLKALDMLGDLFQDSSNYYNRPPSSGSYSFYLNSLVFETADYCGITIDRIAYDCWMNRYATFLLIYNKEYMI